MRCAAIASACAAGIPDARIIADDAGTNRFRASRAESQSSVRRKRAQLLEQFVNCIAESAREKAAFVANVIFGFAETDYGRRGHLANLYLRCRFEIWRKSAKDGGPGRRGHDQKIVGAGSNRVNDELGAGRYRPSMCITPLIECVPGFRCRARAMRLRAGYCEAPEVAVYHRPRSCRRAEQRDAALHGRAWQRHIECAASPAISRSRRAFRPMIWPRLHSRPCTAPARSETRSVRRLPRVRASPRSSQERSSTAAATALGLQVGHDHNFKFKPLGFVNRHQLDAAVAAGGGIRHGTEDLARAASRAGPTRSCSPLGRLSRSFQKDRGWHGRRHRRRHYHPVRARSAESACRWRRLGASARTIENGCEGDKTRSDCLARLRRKQIETFEEELGNRRVGARVLICSGNGVQFRQDSNHTRVRAAHQATQRDLQD